MSEIVLLSFQDPEIGKTLAELSPTELDQLGFGVIGFDADTIVRCYNQAESRLAGLAPDRVLGHPLFTVVAPCMNNFMVAHRFEEAATGGTALDATLNYVLTLRMKPLKVVLRLIAMPGAPLRYVLVNRAI